MVSAIETQQIGHCILLITLLLILLIPAVSKRFGSYNTFNLNSNLQFQITAIYIIPLNYFNTILHNNF